MILAFFVLSCTATLYLYFYFRLATIAPLKRVFSSFPRLTTSNSSALKNHKCSTRSMQAHEPTSETHAIFEGHRTRDDLLGGHGSKTPKRIIVAMTGATGSILGVHLLKILKRMNIETHLIVSKWAAATLIYETDFTVKDLKALATRTYAASDVAAPISSGSFKTLGMIIVPCSMKTLSAVATGFGEDLVTRAADVVLKERRKFVVVARETPLNAIRLNNMLTITNSGGIIFPPVPAFYTKPQSVDDIVSQSVGRMLDMFDLDTEDFERWTGMH